MLTTPRVFLSHSHRDDEFTMRLVQDLRSAGIEVWVDVAALHDGNFLQRINEALGQCEWLVLVQTPNSLRSPAVRTEVDAAINLVWRGRMRGVIPFIASPCDPDEVPPTWAVLHYYDGTRDYTQAFTSLVTTLTLGQSQPMTQPLAPPAVLSSTPLPSPTLPGAANPELVPDTLRALGFEGRTINGNNVILPPMCDVPAGPFWMGSDKSVDAQAQDHETPQSEVFVGAFQIAKYPLTLIEFSGYVASRDNPLRAGMLLKEEAGWPSVWADQIKDGNWALPITSVVWDRAVAYAKWLTQLTGLVWRLPTEAQWEKAARGTDKRLYPWGNQWDESRANTAEGGPDMVMPINTYTAGASPYGVIGMAGNVYEWCSTLWFKYPYVGSDGREAVANWDTKKAGDAGPRVIRGGSFRATASEARVCYRWYRTQYKQSDYDTLIGRDNRLGDVGFRLVRIPTFGTS